VVIKRRYRCTSPVHQSHLWSRRCLATRKIRKRFALPRYLQHILRKRSLRELETATSRSTKPSVCDAVALNLSLAAPRSIELVACVTCALLIPIWTSTTRA
jgi:hypothetical protein